MHNDRFLFKNLTTFILAICEKSHLVFSHSCYNFQFFQYPFTKKHYKVIISTSYSICYQYFLNMFFQLKFYILKFQCLCQKIDGFSFSNSFCFLQRASPGAQTVKRLPTKRETRVRSLGQEVPLKKEIATHSSILAWKIPQTKKPGRLQSMGSQRVGHD